MSEKPRVVFDCNTFLQALASPEGPAGHCVQLGLTGQILLFVSPIVLAELRDVATRPKLESKLRLKTDRVNEFIEMIELAAFLLDGFPEEFRFERDPDDAHYVNLALAAHATLIVTRDHDLLDLMDPTCPGSSEFRSRYPELRIVTPVQLVSVMTG